MNDAPSPTSLERSEKLQGMGCKRKRVEDVRFTQGRGNYVDDIKLPGMLHGDFHRATPTRASSRSILPKRRRCPAWSRS
jgi:carbon-monoxide dehydrogenase large subunit